VAHWPEALLLQKISLWTLADTLGLMIGAPIVLALPDPGLRRTILRRNLYWSGAALFVLTLAVAGVFAKTGLGLRFLIFAPMLVVVFQLETLGAALSVLLTTVLAVTFMINGHDPMGAAFGGPSDREILLQIFLIAAAAINFPVAAVLADRRRAHDRVRVDAARARLISRYSRDIVVRLGLDRRILDASLGVRRYGYEPEDLIGLFAGDTSHPEDRATVTAMVDGLVADPTRNMSTAACWRLRTAMGDWVWMECALTLVRDPAGEPTELVAVMRDITADKAAAEAVANTQTNFRLLADSSIDVIVQTRLGGVIDYLSPSVERMTGYGVDELIGTDIYRLIHPEDKPRVHAAFDAFLARPDDQPRVIIEYRLIGKDGRIIWIEASPYLLRDRATAEVLGLGGFLRDVTERRSMEEDLRSKQAEAEASEAARRAAEQSVRETEAELARVARLLSVGEFAASVAHELNQPIAAIVTNSDTSLRWLDKEPPNLEEAKAAITRTIRDATRAAQVIIRTRAMLAKAPAKFTTLDFNACAKEVLLFTDIELRRHQIVVVTQFSPSLPRVSGDRIQLQQVMINLVRNSIEAMAENDGQPRRLTLSTTLTEDGEVMFSVEDTGGGLKPEAAERLFDSFFTTKIGGVGLGLPISRSIIEAHGGRLWAEQDERPYAVFRFTLPAMAAE